MRTYYIVILLAVFLSSCVGGAKIVSTTNQAPAQLKTIMEVATSTETRPDGTVVVTEKIIYTNADGKKATSVNVKEQPLTSPNDTQETETSATEETATVETPPTDEKTETATGDIVEIQGKKFKRNADGTMTAIGGDTPEMFSDVEINGIKYKRNPDGTLTEIKDEVTTTSTPPAIEIPAKEPAEIEKPESAIIELGGKKYTRNLDGTLTEIKDEVATTTPPPPVVETPVNDKPEEKPEEEADQPATTSSVADGIDTAKDATYMTTREKEMIKEINLVRSNPKGYIPLVREYRKQVENTTFTDPNFAKEELKAIEDLIKELELMSPIAILQPREQLHNTAKKHGDELKSLNKTGHVGADGSYPWDRITRDDAELEDGNENLVGGPEEVRQSVMLLLVDSGIPGYGHRKTLLNPTWKYVACYEAGEVKGFPNYWVQNFAK